MKALEVFLIFWGPHRVPSKVTRKRPPKGPKPRNVHHPGLQELASKLRGQPGQIGSTAAIPGV